MKGACAWTVGVAVALWGCTPEEDPMAPRTVGKAVPLLAQPVGIEWNQLQARVPRGFRCEPKPNEWELDCVGRARGTKPIRAHWRTEIDIRKGTDIELAKETLEEPRDITRVFGQYKAKLGRIHGVVWRYTCVGDCLHRYEFEGWFGVETRKWKLSIVAEFDGLETDARIAEAIVRYTHWNPPPVPPPNPREVEELRELDPEELRKRWPELAGDGGVDGGE